MISTIIRNKTVLVYPVLGVNNISPELDFTYYKTIHVPTVLKKGWISQQATRTNHFFLGRMNGKELFIKSNGKLDING